MEQTKKSQTHLLTEAELISIVTSARKYSQAVKSSAEKINDYLRKIEHEIDQDVGSLSIIEESGELAIEEAGKIDKYTKKQKQCLERITQQSQPR
ncbi:hypothetical protein Rin_00017530 [Candidatus Regiella insecticola 5.15]|uniref:Uncharacterized protein n=1 Tax=Candidatus Regiella insecticola 5.15 TaxID=1005043 RepID=G2H118_9ENTR|nr:hypothetical protein [Candidatus Regiella insecticola]EGY28309.1 hypothetical protein Rin_00017530 [Candidatus Regiella insecticola 5.15]